MQHAQAKQQHAKTRKPTTAPMIKPANVETRERKTERGEVEEERGRGGVRGREMKKESLHSKD